LQHLTQCNTTTMWVCEHECEWWAKLLWATKNLWRIFLSHKQKNSTYIKIFHPCGQNIILMWKEYSFSDIE
jgi:hypothetical protein